MRIVRVALAALAFAAVPGHAESEVAPYAILAVRCGPDELLSGVTLGDRTVNVAAGEAIDAFVKRAVGDLKAPVVIQGTTATQERCVAALVKALQQRKVRVIATMAMPPMGVGGE